MNKKFCLGSVACLTSIFIFAQHTRFSFSQEKMGSPFNIILYETDSVTANQRAASCYVLIDSLNKIFSDYDPESELNKLAFSAKADSFIKLSEPLSELIWKSKQAWEISNHAFDISVGVLSKLWRQARKSGIFPLENEVQQALLKTGFEKIAIDTLRRSVKFLIKDMQLDVGGIAKGYIAQQCAEYLKFMGTKNFLLDAGGDIVAGEAPDETKGWKIGINQLNSGTYILQKKLTLVNTSVATSGDIYQYLEHKGKRYSHIINPLSGYGITQIRNVTVIAKDGTTADWMASACSIVPLKKVKSMATQVNAEVMIVYIKNKHNKVYCTKGFKAYFNDYK